MKNLVINGKYNLSEIMKLAHKFLSAGSRNLSSALRKAWDWAFDQMHAFKQESWTTSNIVITGEQMKSITSKLD
jgi:hypothetical protein